MGLFLFSYFLLINALSVYLMFDDKRKAIQKAWRVPESNFFFLALSGGFIGVYLGMKYARHKTQHWQFHAVVICSALLWFFALPAFYLYVVH